ncbi:MAG: PhoU domain-containing protein [Pirellulaceae bacterium]|nr:hypothetical protein [Planctomycetales bacterium]MCA9209763.1 hypothetical protein [Planctomycetales bacterium]MCA9219125.1 hypothetical protein [Planctomycetales bacterium]
MFEWFSGNSGKSPGLKKMQAEFAQMLESGRHMFDAAANAMLGGTDLQVIRNDLFETDKRINQAEQRIRREIVVHATVHGASSFPQCLLLMSVVKDAERLGDYAKNIFDIAEQSGRLPDNERKRDLISLKDQLSQMLADCREAFIEQDHNAAGRLIVQAREFEDHCDSQVETLLRGNVPEHKEAAIALAYRHFKRIAGHAHNVLTSIVQPLDKIDFSSEEFGKKKA